ncbi:C39 family peptidase [Kribbella lupini]|uniref:Peptidase C39-like domain-containing protein n=1 Tax=Kribbella lupini TaxID=291602 RepID=A0ABN2ANY3_9ACTN
MRTATRGAAALITLGVLLSQAPLARAYEFVPRDGAVGAAPTTGPLGAEPTAAPSSEVSDRVEPSDDSTPAEPSVPPTAVPTPADDEPVAELPAARSWSELAGQVAATSPTHLTLRATTAEQSKQVMRCFKLETENYCLGLGFVDKIPTGAEISSTVAEPDVARDDLRAGVSAEQDIATGALSPAAFVAERAEMTKGERTNAELEEMQAAWDGRDKARALRELDADGNPPPSSTPAPGSGTTTVPGSDAGRTGVPAAGEPSGGQTVVPKPGDPSTKPTPPPLKPPTVTKPKPVANYIMKGFQTSQDKGYWCGPATFQSIDWADDKQKDTQASWAKDLGATTSGTAITSMVKQTNLKTNWDLAAGTYIVQNVSHWTPAKFLQVHQNHLGDGAPAPVIEHVQLLKRYFPYLAFNHSGHYQVGRGYDTKAKTIGIFEVFNERRFNSRGNVTDGPRNIPATAMFNATLANSFKNIGL